MPVLTGEQYEKQKEKAAVATVPAAKVVHKKKIHEPVFIYTLRHPDILANGFGPTCQIKVNDNELLLDNGIVRTTIKSNSDSLVKKGYILISRKEYEK
jgi:hypothetical protein